MLVVLALIWGASFMFIKVADRQFSPATLILGRLGLAAVTLAAIVPFATGTRVALAALRGNAKWLVIVALVNTAAPFWLLSWGETRIDSGLASIFQAAVPIFIAVISFGFFREVRVTGTRLLGVAVGFVGVALLVGAQPSGKILGAVAVVGMAFCYAIGGLLTGRHLSAVPPVVIGLASTAIAAVVALPAGIVQAPNSTPGWKEIGSVVALGIPGTAVRVPPLLRLDHARRGGVRVSRDVPHPADRARVRGDLPRRALRGDRVRRARARARRRRARHRRGWDSVEACPSSSGARTDLTRTSSSS